MQVSFTVTPGSTITLTNASGASYIDYDNTWSDNADGTSGTSQLWCQDDAKSNGVSEHGIADVTALTVLEAFDHITKLGLPDAARAVSEGAVREVDHWGLSRKRPARWHFVAADPAEFQHANCHGLYKHVPLASAAVLLRQRTNQRWNTAANCGAGQCDAAIHGHPGRLGMEQ